MCEHIPDPDDERLKALMEDFAAVNHEGRFISVLETCPACTPDFLPQRPNGPFTETERYRLVEELRLIWRGGL